MDLIFRDQNVTPLVLACANGSFSTAMLLLDRRANVHVQDINGYTPLHHASYCFGDEVDSATEVVQELLAHGGNPTVKNNEGKTPLDIAKEHEDRNDIVNVLTRHQAKHEENQNVPTRRFIDRSVD